MENSTTIVVNLPGNLGLVGLHFAASTLEELAQGKFQPYPFHAESLQLVARFLRDAAKQAPHA